VQLSGSTSCARVDGKSVLSLGAAAPVVKSVSSTSVASEPVQSVASEYHRGTRSKVCSVHFFYVLLIVPDDLDAFVASYLEKRARGDSILKGDSKNNEVGMDGSHSGEGATTSGGEAGKWLMAEKVCCCTCYS